MLAKILSQRHGFKCTVLFALDPDGTINPDNNTSVPGIEALDSADGIVMQLRFRQWPDAAMKHFADAVARQHPDHQQQYLQEADDGDGRIGRLGR